MPDSVKCLRDIKSDDIRFPKVPKRGRPYMSKIREKITSISHFMGTILVIRKKGVGFKVFEEMSIEKRFEDFSNSGS